MKNRNELTALRDQARKELGICGDGYEHIRIVVGMATCGIAAGAGPVLAAFRETIARKNLNHVTVKQTGCIGVCQYEPVVEVYMPGEEKVTYVNMTSDKVEQIVNAHIIGGSPVIEYTIGANLK